MRPPVDCSSRAVSARTSSGGERRGARDGGVGDALPAIVEATELGGDARQLLDPTPPQQQLDEVLDGSATRCPRAARSTAADRWSMGMAGLDEGAHGSLVAEHGRGRVQLGPPRLERAVTLGDLEGGLRVAARAAVPSGHGQLLRSPPSVRRSARNSWTSRRWRSSVIDSPTTRPAAARARSATSPRSSRDGARLLRLDLGGGAVAHPVELVAGRGDVGVAGLLGDLLGARQDVVRLAAGLGQGRDALRFRALAVAARLLGVLEPLLDGRLAVVERLGQRLERERPDDGQEDQEVDGADEHPEQVDRHVARPSLLGQRCPCLGRPRP